MLLLALGASLLAPSISGAAPIIITFDHEVDHQRFKQQAPGGTTLYLDAFDVQLYDNQDRFALGRIAQAEKQVALARNKP